MDVAIYILFAVTIVAATLFIVLQKPSLPFISLGLKGFASLSIVSLSIVGLTGYFINGGADYMLMFLCVGLAACMLGDVFLAQLEFNNERLTNRIRIFGMLAFSLAQVLFMVFFIYLMGVTTLYGLVFGAVLAVGVYWLSKPLGLNFGKLTWIALSYAFLLGSAFGMSVINLIVNGFSVMGILLAIGLGLFLVSDLILSLIYFGKPKVVRRLYYLNYAAYYAAIILIASVFVFAL